MTEHSPGPWTAMTWDELRPHDPQSPEELAEFGRYWQIDSANCEFEVGLCLHGFFSEADARLIAAAPDLLAALKVQVAVRSSDDPGWLADLARAEAAIAKAEGRE